MEEPNSNKVQEVKKAFAEIIEEIPLGEESTSLFNTMAEIYKKIFGTDHRDDFPEIRKRQTWWQSLASLFGVEEEEKHEGL